MRIDRPDLRGDIYYHSASEMALSQLYYLFSAGDFHCRVSYQVQRGGILGGVYHPSCQLIYTVSGVGYVEFRGSVRVVQTGDIAIMDCREPHSYGTSTDWHKLWVHFDGQNSRQLVDIFVSRYGHVVHSSINTRIPNRLKQILDSLQVPEPLSEPATSAAIYSMLMEILSEPSEKVPYGDGYVSTVAKAVSFIQGNLDGRISVEHLAQCAGLSPSQFTRLFKAEMGCSPRQYILDTKVENAKRLLNTTDLTVKEIGVYLGFKYESHFVSVFKQRVGVSPKRFQIGKRDYPS